MDERVKHRLIGLAVILSIGAIFAPAIMKKSSQRIDANMIVSVKLPAKPSQPNIDMTAKKGMFENAKVAHVELPSVNDKQLTLPSLAKAESLSKSNEKNELPGERLALADIETKADSQALKTDTQSQKPQIVSAKVAAVHKVAKGLKFSAPPAKSKEVAKNPKVIKPLEKNTFESKSKKGFTIQLATFSQQRNADNLISKLKMKGYVATSSRVKTSDGFVYKVLVGQVNKKEQAQELQAKLANALQMKGFIIATGEG